MKLELLDTYNIRARLSASIILLAPIALTCFLCFDEITTFATSTVFISLLLSFTNYLPILQRHICRKRNYENYALQLLRADDTTLDAVSKKRYYDKLAKTDESFMLFATPNNSKEFSACCDSAVIYLRNHTRDNHIVQEELINYGFYKNLLSSKSIGITICILLCVVVSLYSWLKFGQLSSIPTENYFSTAVNLIMIFFWVFGVTEEMFENTAKEYAKVLITAIDTIEI